MDESLRMDLRDVEAVDSAELDRLKMFPKSLLLILSTASILVVLVTCLINVAKVAC